MKRSVIFIAIFLLLTSLNATHLKCAYFTYQWLGGMTYQITLTTYTDPTSPANVNTISAMINFGDGTSDTVQRSGPQVLDNDDPHTAKNIYIKNHTFSSTGDYHIVFTDQNLIDGIVNVNHGDTKNLAYSTEALIKIDASLVSRSSPLALSFIGEPNAILYNDLYYNPSFFSHYINSNFGYDSLSFEFTNPNLPNFVLPSNLTINPYNGMIKWKNIPFIITPSIYLICYKVNIFSNHQFAGYTVVKQLVKVLNAITSSSTFPSVNFPNTDSTSGAWSRKIVTSANYFSQEVNYTINSTFPTTTSFFGNMPFNSFIDASTISTARYFMNFNPDSTFIPQNFPYFFTVRNTLTYSGQPVTRDYSLAVYYGAPISFSVKELNAKNPAVNVFPNPFKNSCKFLMNDNSGSYQIFISDLSGKQIFSGKIKGNEFSFDATNLKPGNYFYSIQNDEGNAVKGKLILLE
ncbi:MAG: T9SS type A sorting domain-containing protein [Bacteroidia bacterium]